MKTRSFFLLFIGGAMFLGSCRGGGGGGWLGLAFLHHQNRRSIPTPTTAAIVNWKDDYSTTFSPSRKAARTLLRSISTKKTSSGSTNSESDASSPSSSPMSSGMEQDSDTLLHLPEFTSKEEYIQYLSLHAALPQGFQCGSASGKFVAVEAPMLGPLNIKATVVYLNEPTRNWAACFTKNKFPGAPIIVGRKRLENKAPLQALVINNKVSNVCSGGNGVQDSEHVCEAVSTALQLAHGPQSVLPSSTGVIGWNLPAKELANDVIPNAIKALQSDSALIAAQAIMTTDRFPKLRSCTLPSCGARVVGIAKGAGMIEPNMATMLSYIFTDAAVDQHQLSAILSKAVNQSYNSISVDGDESTSDTVVLLSSNVIPLSSDIAGEGQEKQQDEESGEGAIMMKEFETAVTNICRGLASDIVRNGEGTGHVIRVQVMNYPGTDHDARRLGRHVVNSPLFKCAVSGNDPNTGRLAAAIGSFLGKINDDKMDEEINANKIKLTLGGRTIFDKGQFMLGGDEVEQELRNHMKNAEFGECDDYPAHQRFVEVGVNFNGGGVNNGGGCATVLGSDLTAEYVFVNADYRS